MLRAVTFVCYCYASFPRNLYVVSWTGLLVGLVACEPVPSAQPDYYSGILPDAVSHCPTDISATFGFDDPKGGIFQREYLGATSQLKCMVRGPNGQVRHRVMMAIPLELLPDGDNSRRHRTEYDEEIVVKSWARVAECPTQPITYKDNQWMIASIGIEQYYRSYPVVLSCLGKSTFSVAGIDYPSFKIKQTYYLDGGFQLDNERVYTYIELSKDVYFLAKIEKTENSTDLLLPDSRDRVYTVNSITRRDKKP